MVTNEDKGEIILKKIMGVILASALSLGVLAGCGNESSSEVEELKKQVSDLQNQVEEQEEVVKTEVENSELDSTTDLSQLLGAWVFDSGQYSTGDYIEISENDGLLRVDWKYDDIWEPEGFFPYIEYEIINYDSGKWTLNTVDFGGAPPLEDNKKQTIIEIKDGKIITFPLVTDKEYSAVKVDTSLRDLKNIEKLNGEWKNESGAEFTLQLENGYLIESTVNYDSGVYYESHYRILGITEDNRLVSVLEKKERQGDVTIVESESASLISLENDDIFIENFEGEESKFTRK